MPKRELNNGPVIQKEKETVSQMIAIYCRKKHHRKTLCEECLDLQNYCLKRLSYCRFGEEKARVPTARSIATGKTTVKKSGRSCVFPARGCFCTIPFFPSGIY